MRQRVGIPLNHLDRMTDSTGLIQHAIYSIPRRASGYTTDDNVRALRLCVRLWGQYPGRRMLGRVTKYLSFVEYAHCPEGGFHNFMSYRRHWIDRPGSGDCMGQVVLALAEVLGSGLPESYRTLARELIESTLPLLADLRSLRAQAYVVMAWGHLQSAGVTNVEPLEAIAWSAARRILDCYEKIQKPDWPWFEPRLTYANAVLPHALFVAGRHWPNEKFLSVAETTFAFLDTTTTVDGFFWPVGNLGWYVHGATKAGYDQQPVEAATMADAAFSAYHLTGEAQYRDAFLRARDWFHGKNSLQLSLVETRRGACYDGLQSSGLNQNQGAESTLVYLWTELRSAGVQALPSDSRAVAAHE